MSRADGLKKGILMYKAPITDMKFALRVHREHNAHLADSLPDDEMIDVILTEAAKLAGDVIAPLNHSADKAGGAKRHDDGTVSTPEGFAGAFHQLAEGGWTSMEAKEAFGGQEMPLALSSCVNEMWQASNMAFSLCHLLTQGLISALQHSASDAQKAQFLPPMVEGRWTGTMNLTEPQAGTDLAAIKTKAVKTGDHYLLSGQKIYITYGEHDMAENIIHLVLARTPDAPEGHKGISVFLVPKYLINEDGSLGARNDVHCVSIEKKLGIKGSPTAVLQYGDNGGAVGYLVGEENQGLAIMFGMMNHARFNVGLQGLALSDRALQQALSYAETRVQGTPLAKEAKSPIIHHPDVMRLLGQMKAESEAMRALMIYGAALLDEAEASDDGNSIRADFMIPIIKGWLTEQSQIMTSHNVQIHGGMGFIEETGAAQHYRDARILPIYEGTTAIQSNDLLFRKTIRDEGREAKALIAEITSEADAQISHDDEAISLLATDLQAKCQEAEDAINSLLARRNDARDIAASGVPYLMMLGTLTGGWHLLRQGVSASSALRQEGADTAFLRNKLASCRLFAALSLPQASAYAQMALRAGQATESLSVEDWLA